MGIVRLAAAVFAAVWLAFGSNASLAADPLKIRIAWIAVPANLAPILFAKDGIAKHHGKSYVLEPVRFQGTTQMLTAIGAGELDIASLSPSSFALAIENAGMRDLRLIADDYQGSVDGYFSEGYLVLKDSPYQKREDLKGKVLATNGVGGNIDMILRSAMRKVGMEDKRDYTIIEAPLPAMKAMLAEKKVDLIPASIPFAHDPELKSISRMLFTQREIAGSSQTLLLAARTGYIEKNRAALVDFMEDIIRARRFYLDPANQKEAVQIIANFTKQPPRNYEGWLFTKEDAFRDPMAIPNVEAMQRNIGLQRELGFLKTAIDVNAFSDLSMVREAGPRAK